MRLLVVEDNPKIMEFLKKGLQSAGFSVETCGDGDEAFQTVIHKAFDMLVLDVLLPGMDGVRLTEELRRRGITTPILMLTALDQVEDKVRGLEAGADDYLSKPFAFAELVARIHALGRRHTMTDADMTILKYYDLELDADQYKVTRGGVPIELTPREFSLLKVLMGRPERIITRTALLEQVWDMNYDTSTNILDVHISHLRQKLDGGRKVTLLQTIRGVGFMLKVKES